MHLSHPRSMLFCFMFFYSHFLHRFTLFYLCKFILFCEQQYTIWITSYRMNFIEKSIYIYIKKAEIESTGYIRLSCGRGLKVIFVLIYVVKEIHSLFLITIIWQKSQCMTLVRYLICNYILYYDRFAWVGIDCVIYLWFILLLIVCFSILYFYMAECWVLLCCSSMGPWVVPLIIGILATIIYRLLFA